MTTLTNLTIGSNDVATPKLICGMDFVVDANGRIKENKITEDDLKEEQFTADQNASLSACVSRLLNNALEHSSEILQMLPNEEKKTVEFVEHIPESVFGMNLDVQFSLEPYSDIILFLYKIKTDEVAEWPTTASGGAIRVNDFEETLKDDAFHERGVKTLRELILKKMENIN